MQPTTILIVDDEPDIREVMRFALENDDYTILEANHAAEARDLILTAPPDLILLDWMLPGRSGLEFAQQLKQNPKTKHIPIVIVSARAEESDRICGLDQGAADDYITKPFSPRELVLRVKAVLRRTQTEEAAEIVMVKGLVVDNISHKIIANGQNLELAPTEYRLLDFFMRHQDRAFTRSQLLDQVWGNATYVEERTVDVHVRRLRKILEATGHDQLLQTVRSVGYRFSVDSD